MAGHLPPRALEVPTLHPQNFWYSQVGNMLKGIEGDPENPLRLQDWLIVDLMQGTKKARDDFRMAFLALNAKEQERVQEIVDTYHLMDPPPILDPVVLADQNERWWNGGLPVRTQGKPFGSGAPGWVQLPPDLVLKKDNGV